jgi:DNA end-binding protein Ku
MPRRPTPRKEPPKFRASWSGTLRFGLVSIPIEAVNAHTPEEGGTHFHQLHEECHSRIRYVKVCPIHGEVRNDEIVPGYEFARDQYVEVDPQELKALRSNRERSLNIDSFVSADAVDPVYLDGRMYFLIPDGENAREAYSVFLEGLRRQHKYGIGQVIFSGKEQAALVRPYDGVLLMSLLNYKNEIRAPEEVLGKLPAIGQSNKRTIQMVEQLIESWGKEKFDYSDYVDEYETKVRELIDAKVEGREIVAPEADAEPEVVNLMDALRRSMKSAPRSATTKSKPKPRAKATRGRRGRQRQAS